MPAGNHSNTRTNYYSICKDIVERRGQIFHKESGQFFSFLEGFLIDIKIEDGEYDGQPTHKIKFYFADDKFESIDCLTVGRHTVFTRSILSCLANIKGIGWVRTTVYISEDDKTGKKFVQGAVRHCDTFIGDGIMKDNFKVQAKYKKGDYPEVEVLKTKSGKVVHDSSERDKFFDNLIPGIIGNLAYSRSSVKTNGNGNGSHAVTGTAVEDDPEY